MPNWVTTDITITGSESEINKIITAAKLNPKLFGKLDDGQVFDFNGFVPMPEKLFHTRSPADKTLLVLMLAEENPSLADDDVAIIKNMVKIYHDTPMGSQRGLCDFQVEVGSMAEDIEKHFPNMDKLSEVLLLLGNHAEYQTEKNKPENQLNFECLKEFGYSDWHVWAVVNWGTKWNSCNISANVTKDGEQTTLLLAMDTAWDTPVSIFNHIKKNYNVIIDGLAADECGNFAATIKDGDDEVEVYYYHSDEDLDKINSICLDVLGYKPFDDENDE